jgi:hypothetical protein
MAGDHVTRQSYQVHGFLGFQDVDDHLRIAMHTNGGAWSGQEHML